MSDYTPPTQHEQDARLVFRLLSMAKHQENPRTAELMEAVAKRLAVLTDTDLTPVPAKPERWEDERCSSVSLHRGKMIPFETHKFYDRPKHLREVLLGDIDPDVARELVEVADEILDELETRGLFLSKQRRLRELVVKAKGER